MLVLDTITAANRGKRIVFFAQFGPKDAALQRWLAAPKIVGRVSTGRFVFTPNATREEADQIALGLNNAALERDKHTLFKDE